MCLLHRVCIFQLYLVCVKKFYLSGQIIVNLWFKVNPKPHYVYTVWLHKISPNLIVCRICSINSIRNPRQGFANNRSKTTYTKNQASKGTNAGANFIRSEWCNFSHQFHVFTAQGVIFHLYLEFVWRNSIFLVKSLLIYDLLIMYILLTMNTYI
jgi:hypothetical protein